MNSLFSLKNTSSRWFFATHLKNMRPSKWIISPGRGEKHVWKQHLETEENMHPGYMLNIWNSFWVHDPFVTFWESKLPAFFWLAPFITPRKTQQDNVQPSSTGSCSCGIIQIKATSQKPGCTLQKFHIDHKNWPYLLFLGSFPFSKRIILGIHSSIIQGCNQKLESITWIYCPKAKV